MEPLLPFSQACENNKSPILEILRTAFADRRHVLEIGSGTGQHATHFAAHLPHLVWQPSELPQNQATLLPRCRECESTNLLPPVIADVRAPGWYSQVADAVFTANTLHIMSLDSVHHFFAGIGERADDDCVIAVYGPFNYRGSYTSESNARFDAHLAAQNPASGIRDFELIDELARDAGLALVGDNAMPANNRLLVWRSQRAVT